MTKIRIHYSKEQFGKPLIGLFIGVVIFLVGIFLKYVLFPTIIADKVAEVSEYLVIGLLLIILILKFVTGGFYSFLSIVYNSTSSFTQC